MSGLVCLSEIGTKQAVRFPFEATNNFSEVFLRVELQPLAETAVFFAIYLHIFFATRAFREALAF